MVLGSGQKITPQSASKALKSVTELVAGSVTAGELLKLCIKAQQFIYVSSFVMKGKEFDGSRANEVFPVQKCPAHS